MLVIFERLGRRVLLGIENVEVEVGLLQFTENFQIPDYYEISNGKSQNHWLVERKSFRSAVAFVTTRQMTVLLIIIIRTRKS